MSHSSAESLSPQISIPMLADALEQFSKLRVLIIGDVMLDEYLTGDAERISPEAPVPVVRVTEEKHLVGGAGNVARNITALGGQAVLIGARGSDEAGRIMENRLHEDRIVFSFLSQSDRPTTVKTRILARQQQVLRIDREGCAPLADADVDALLGLAAEYVPDCSAVVISDYGKGIVSERFMQGLQAIVAASGRSVPLLVDPKPRNFRLYRGIDVMTPNAKETSESIHMPVSSPTEIVHAGQAVMDALDCPQLLVTLGAQGMAVFQNRNEVWHIPTTAQQVFDVTGAGDTVIAALALGCAAGLPLVHACLLANYAAGLVVGMVGAGTADPQSVIQAASKLPIPQLAKWA